jgi:tape measure domain-containing protein
MAVKRVGIEPVVENLSKFLNDAASINDAVSRLGQGAKISASGFEMLGYTFNTTLKRWQDAQGRMVAATTVTQAYQSTLSQLSTAALSASQAVANIGTAAAKLSSAATSGEAFNKSTQKTADNAAKAAQSTERLGNAAKKAGKDVGGIAGGASASSGAVDKLSGSFDKVQGSAAKADKEFRRKKGDLGDVSNASTNTSSALSILANGFDSVTSKAARMSGALKELGSGSVKMLTSGLSDMGDVIEGKWSEVLSGGAAGGAGGGGGGFWNNMAAGFQGFSQNAGQFLQVLALIRNGFSLLTPVIGVATTLINAFSGAFNGLMNIIRGFWEGAINGLKNVFGWFGKIFTIGAGYAFGKMLVWIGNEIREMGQNAVQAASDFQLLEIRFRTVAGRDIARELGVPIKDTFEAASLQAKQLLEWVRQLAVTTPYKATDVARSLALANAYGLQSKSAQVLVQATLDFAAAMGLTEDHIYRIIYNFGQMQQQGKLTGREFRDLAISFVPVYDILGEMADEAGVAKDAFIDMAMSGGVPVEQFFRKFVDMSQRDFKGAAKEMSTTLQGVYDNIKDTFQLLVGVDLLGPIAKTMAEALNSILNVMKTFREGAMIMGGVLKLSFYNVANAVTKSLLPALGNLASSLGMTWQGAQGLAQGMAQFAFGIRAAVITISGAINQIANWVRNNLGKLQDNGHTWGYNLVMQFAKGMAAAIKFIVQVIGAIANLIAKMFAPGSPPLIAPQIDVWGKKMMQVWADGIGTGAEDAERVITDTAGGAVRKGFENASKGATTAKNPITKAVVDFAAQARRDVQPLLDRFGSSVMASIAGGWTSANFSMFSDLSGSIDSFVRSLEGISISEEGIVPVILGSRRSIAEAITAVRSGLSSVGDAVKKIVSSIGQAPQGLGDYVTALFKAKEAQSNLTNAQKIGNSVLESNEQILSKLTGSVREAGDEYYRALSTLAAATDNAARSQEELDRITKFYEGRLRELNAALTAVTETYDQQNELQEINKALATKILTTKERERLEMKKKAILLKQEITATEAQRDAEVAAAQTRVDMAKASEEAAKKEADKRQKYLTEMAEAQADAAKEQVDAAKALIDMQTEQNDLIREQMSLLEKLAQDKSGSGAGAEAGLGNDLQDLMDQIENFKIPNVNDTVSKIMQDARTGFAKWAEEMKKTIAEAFGYSSWDSLSKDFNDKLITPIQTAFTNFNTWWNEKALPLFNEFITKVKPAFDALGDATNRFGKALDGITVSNGMALVLEWFLALTGGTVILGTLALAGVINMAARALDTFNTTMDTFNKIVAPFAKQVDILEQKMRMAKDPIDKISLALQALGLTIVGTLVEMWGIAVAITTTATEAVKNILWDLFILPVISYFAQLKETLVGHSIIPDMMNEIYNVMTGKFTELKSWIGTWISDQLTAWSGFLTETKSRITSDMSKMYETAKVWADQVRVGLTEKFNYILGEGGTVPTFLYNVGVFFRNAFSALKDAASTGFDGVRQGVEGVLNGIGDWINGKVKEWTDALRTLTDLAGKIGNANNSANNNANKNATQTGATIGTNLAKGIGKAFMKEQDMNSPSKKFEKFGKWTMQGYMNGIEKQTSALARTFATQSASMRRAAPVQSATTNNRTVNVNVNANYAQQQSPVSIYYDISAALASSRM